MLFAARSIEPLSALEPTLDTASEGAVSIVTMGAWSARAPRSGRGSLAPLLPGARPIVGHAFDFVRHPVTFLRQGRERYGDAFTVRLPGKLVTVLTGCAGHRAFFAAPEDVLSARECYQFTVPIFGDGVAYGAAPTIMDEQLFWVQPALGERRMKLYAELMVSEVDAYVGSWLSRGEIDLAHCMQELTTFIAVRCLLGREVRESLTEEFSHLYEDLEAGMTWLAYFAPNAPTPAFRRRNRARRRVTTLLGAIIAERRRTGRREDDFLQTLMEARYADGSEPTDEVVVGILLTLIFAGQHTSAALATWTGILLHKHRQYLLPVREEVDQAAQCTPLAWDALRSVPLLEFAVREAERLHPPLVMLMRAVLRDMKFGDYLLPAGSLAMVSPAVSHRIPEVFAHPEEYDPHRFSPGRDEHRRPYALIGFGGGKHRCMGTAFAMQQVKLIWTRLLTRFDFELVLPEYTPNYDTFVVGPRRPASMRYQLRATAEQKRGFNGTHREEWAR